MSFEKLPGSHVIARYVNSSHQNDPCHPVLDILLFLFAICTLLQSRTCADNGEIHFIQCSEKVCLLSTRVVILTPIRQEVNELVDDWTPDLLGAILTPEEQIDLASIPVVSSANVPRPTLANAGRQVLNLASYNFTGLAGNESVK